MYLACGEACLICTTLLEKSVWSYTSYFLFIYLFFYFKGFLRSVARTQKRVIIKSVLTFLAFTDV